MTDGSYKWIDFKNEVLGLMPLESDRLIQGDDGQFMTRLIKLAVIDLQRAVRVYTLNHETVYLPSDFAQEGSASHAVLPPNARLRDAWLIDLGAGVRHPVTEFPWEQRFEMVSNRMNIKDNNGRIAMDPYGYTFYIYPAVAEGTGRLVSLYWDGLKTDFQDNEETPFDTLAVEAAAEFVQGKLARPVQNDLNLYNSYFHPQIGSYTQKRRECFLNAKERTRVSQ